MKNVMNNAELIATARVAARQMTGEGLEFYAEIMNKLGDRLESLMGQVEFDAEGKAACTIEQLGQALNRRRATVRELTQDLEATRLVNGRLSETNHEQRARIGELEASVQRLKLAMARG